MAIAVYERIKRKAAAFMGMLLYTSATCADEDGVALLAGIGTPTTSVYGGQTLDTDQVALGLQADATNVDACLRLTIDGGSSWTAIKPGSLDWYSGTIVNAAADDATGIHASNDDDTQAWPGAITSPVVPRNVTVTFGSAWAGGDVTFTGIDQFDAVISEIIADATGLVTGTKIFKTVTGIAHELLGPGGLNHGASAGWGHKLGVTQTLAAQLGVLAVDGINEAATWDDTYHAFIPTTIPDGAHDYSWTIAT